MRKIAHLSPTSIALYAQDPDEFYLRYLADNGPPREPQTKAMAVGSAFDAYVKSVLHEHFYGKGADPKFEFKTLFEAQVEPQNRDEALIAGGHCFEMYRRLGAFADLMLDFSKCLSKPQFEMDLKGAITSGAGLTREGFTAEVVIEDVTVVFKGKPDCFFTTVDGAHVILDFKVNGYYSNSAPSPKQGYSRLRADGKMPTQHEKCRLVLHNGVWVNDALCLEDVDEDWARQLTIYSLQTGQPVGSKFVARIEQLVCSVKNADSRGRPAIRTAALAFFVSPTFQHKVFSDAASLWRRLTAPEIHYFHDLDFDTSKAKCELLDKRAAVLYGGGEKSANEKFFMQAMKRSF